MMAFFILVNMSAMGSVCAILSPYQDACHTRDFTFRKLAKTQTAQLERGGLARGRPQTAATWWRFLYFNFNS
jgi:hypothetical protein